jgi:hypothetical protein
MMFCAGVAHATNKLLASKGSSNGFFIIIIPWLIGYFRLAIQRIGSTFTRTFRGMTSFHDPFSRGFDKSNPYRGNAVGA